MIPWVGISVVLAAAEPLALSEAVAEALEKNEVPELADAQVVQARAARRRALAAWFPTADLSASYTRRAREARPNGAVLQANDAFGGLLLVQSRLFDATQITDLSAAGARLDAQRASAAATDRAFVFEVADAFFLVLAAEGTAQAAAQRLELAEQVESDTKERVRAGLASTNDRSRVELETASARLAATQADNALNQARLSLGFLLARPVREPLAPSGALVVQDPGAESLYRQAVEARPDLEALRRQLVARRQDALEPWLRLVPFIDAAGRFTLTNETGFVGEEFNWNLSLTATWNLYDGGVRYADARDQAARRRAAELELARLERTTRLEIEQARTDRVTAVAALAQAEQRLRVAELNYEEVQARYRSGLSTSLEQADASVQLFEARVALAAARFDNRLAELALLEATGARLPVGGPAEQATTPSSSD